MEIRAAVAGIAASVLAFTWAGETAQAQEPPPEPPGPTIERISLWAGDAQAIDPSKSPSVSDDGRYVVFLSNSTPTTFPGAPTGRQVCFLRDRVAGTTTPISLYGGTPFPNVRGCVISGNGKFATFAANATGFLPAANVLSLRDVFWLDLETGTVVLISRRSDGNTGGGENPSISDDGQRVAFEANCNYLLDFNDPSEFGNICVWDTGGGITQISNPIRPSIIEPPTFPADEADGASISPVISGDGNWVAFASKACNLVGDGTCFFPRSNDTKLYHIYVASSSGGGAKLLSSGSGGVAGNEDSALPAISDNGGYVAFLSWADNLEINDLNGRIDVFVKDVGNGALKMVNVSNDGAQADLDSAGVAINGDGTLVAFSSQARTLDTRATSGQWQTYLRDHINQKTHLVSAEPGGDPGLWSSTEPAIDDSGKWIAFSTREPFVGGDTNNTEDIYLRDMGDLQGPVAALRVLPNPVAVDTPILISGLIDDEPRGGSNIVEAEYAIWRCFTVGCPPNAPQWLPLLPTDGLFDSPLEAVAASLDVGLAEAGPYNACLRATDSSGNRGAPVCLRLTAVALSAGAADTDGDGLLDAWEQPGGGIDLDGDGIIDIVLADIGADPLRKDIFVEVDCLASDGNGDEDFNDPEDHTHCPLSQSIEIAVQVFANAPVNNPDGSAGIQLHVDLGPAFGAGTIFPVAGTGGVTGAYGDLGEGGDLIAENGRENKVIDWNGAVGKPGKAFHELKADFFNFDRAPAFHYALFAHQVNLRADAGFFGDEDDKFYDEDKEDNCLAGGSGDTGSGNGGPGQICSEGSGFDTTSGWAERFSLIGGSESIFSPALYPPESIPHPGRMANDFIVSLGADVDSDDDGVADGLAWDRSAPDYPLTEGGTFLHELVHNMGVGHGGADETHRKPNYLSIMNYAFQLGCSIPEMPLLGIPGQCDLSRYAFPTLDETNLDECAGIDQNTQRICILGVGGTLDSFPQGDDIETQDGTSIVTGANGRCDSARLNDDFAVAEDACLLAGANGLFEASTQGDDIVDGLQILPGPDGVCQTIKNLSAYCMAAGPNRVIDTVILGDDSDQISLVGDGPNNVCETLVPVFDDQINDDIQLGVSDPENLERIDLGPIDWNDNKTLEGLSCAPPGFTLPWDNSTNITADLNRDSSCVRPGADGTLDSAALGDDVVVGQTIFVGPNRKCESELEKDDVYPRTPNRSKGYLEPSLLTGYDDWNHLNFGFQAYPTYDDAEAASADKATLEETREFFQGLAVPELVMNLSGPAEAVVGETATYTASLENLGGGPAMGSPAVVRVGGTVVDEFEYLPIKAGVPAEIAFQHSFSDADIGQEKQVELELHYGGLFGGDFTVSSFFDTLVIADGGDNRTPTAEAGPDRSVEATSPAGANVTLDGSGSDDLDGDALTYLWSGAFGTTGGISPNVVLPLGTNDVSLVVNDGQVNSASDMAQITVSDTTPPTVSVSCPQTVALDSNEMATVLVTDGVSGVASQSHANGDHALDTATAGAKAFPVTAEDNAGNSGGGSCDYTVLGNEYDFVGFLAPVDNIPLINTAKAGQSIAMKWQVGDGQGGYISDPGIVASTRYALVACPNEVETVEELMEADDSGDSGLHFDDTDQQFRYVWKTSKSLGGRCAEFILTLDDNNAYRASFAFR